MRLTLSIAEVEELLTLDNGSYIFGKLQFQLDQEQRADKTKSKMLQKSK